MVPWDTVATYIYIFTYALMFKENAKSLALVCSLFAPSLGIALSIKLPRGGAVELSKPFLICRMQELFLQGCIFSCASD